MEHPQSEKPLKKKPMPKETPADLPAGKVVRNWVLSLAGIAFLGFAAWYVFGEDSTPDPVVIETGGTAPSANAPGVFDWLQDERPQRVAAEENVDAVPVDSATLAAEQGETSGWEDDEVTVTPLTVDTAAAAGTAQ